MSMPSAHAVLEVGDQHFDAEAAPREDDRLDAVAQQLAGPVPCREQRALANAKPRIYHGRVVEDEVARPGGSAIIVHKLDRRFDELLG